MSGARTGALEGRIIGFVYWVFACETGLIMASDFPAAKPVGCSATVPQTSLSSVLREKSLQLHKRPHPAHLHRRVRNVKSRLLRWVGVVRGPAHGHHGVAGLCVVVEGDGGQQRERPGEAQGGAGRV